MKIEDLISAVQKKLGVRVDGRAGPETWGAIYAHLVKPTVGKLPPGEAIEAVDERSEKKIATLLPPVQPMARSLVHKAAQSGIRIRILSGLRTYAEQDELYAQGRSKPGPIVTNARGGYSNHNFGIAFDVGVFEGNKYLQESVKYMGVGALGMDLGLEWGGSWKSPVDLAHYQLRPVWARELTEREMLAGLRSRVETGLAVFA